MNKQDEIQDLVSTLNNINFQRAELERIKEQLEPRLAQLLEHGEEGQKSYIAGKFKVTVKSGWIYSLDKDEYKTMGSHLPACFNFVKERVSYDIDKSILRDAEKYASSEDLELIASMVSKKPAKLNVRIQAGI